VRVSEGSIRTLTSWFTARRAATATPQTPCLADQSGRPYAYFVGYEEGVTPAAFVDQLRKARETRVRRDRELAAAKEATGAVRAQKLHAAILSVADGLGSIEDHDDDPVLALYGDEVGEIRRLDPENKHGLKAIYDVRIAARDVYRRRQAVYKELETIGVPTDWAAKIAHIETRLPEIIDNDLRFELEWRRVRYLESNKQYAEAIESVHRLVADPLCPVKERRLLLFSEAMCLRRLGRIDEAVAAFDRQIVAAVDRPQAKLSLMKWRAQVLLASARRADAVAAYRELLESAEPHSPEWTEAIGMLAIALARNDQHQEAIITYRKVIKLSEHSERTDPVAFYLLEIARSQRTLGQDDEARQTLDEMERSIPTAADKPAQQNLIDRLRKELAEMRQSIGPVK
jgi:tetratricopeptide (TPR) repeat protein